MYTPLHHTYNDSMIGSGTRRHSQGANSQMSSVHFEGVPAPGMYV